MSFSPWRRIGWRNLWRNPSRTLITALGLAVGYFAVVVIVSWTDGLTAEMIENSTGLLMGQIQVHSREYRPDRSIYDTIGGRDGTNVEQLVGKLVNDPDIKAGAARVYASGLVSSGESTVAATFMGVDHAAESAVSRILNGLEDGVLPTVNANELLVGTEMMKKLGITVGDEVVVVASAADGSLGNDLFHVVGVYRTGLTDLDGSYAILPLESLQTLVALESGRIHEIGLAAAMTTDPWLAPEVAARLAETLRPFGLNIVVEPWTLLQPQMASYVQLVESWHFIIIGIVFTVAIFGVANTMLIATFERRREFAVMLALGTVPSRVLFAVLWEALILGVFSLLVGLVITLPLIFWFQSNPLDLSLFFDDFTMFGALMRPAFRIQFNGTIAVWAGLALLLTVLVAAIYPAGRASRIPPADTLSGL